MAKKKVVKKTPAKPEATTEAEKKNFWTDKPEGVPSKQCPGCKVYVHSRTGKCPQCGNEFPKPVKKDKAPKTRQRIATPPARPNGRLAEIEAAIQTVEKLGGVEKAKEKLAVVKELGLI